MSTKLSIQSISSGYRPIQDGKQYNQFFGFPDDQDRIIIEDGEVEDTVELMKKVVWKYLSDTSKIAAYLKGNTVEDSCRNIWNFLYNHVQYKLDKRGLEQLRRPCRSWAERSTGIDCDCFSIFVSSILCNLKIPHKFRITKYDQDVYQHVYVVVLKESGNDEIIIDCVLSRFNYEKPFTAKKDFTMSLNGINVAVLSGTTSNVMDLVNDLEGLENLGADNEQERLQAIYSHLVKTRNMIAGKPHLIQDVDYPPAFLKMLDYVISNWNTPNRDKAIAVLSQNEDALNKHFQMDGVPENSDLEGLDNDWDDLDGMSNEEIMGYLGGKKQKEKKQEKNGKKKEKKEQKNEQKKTAPKKKGFFKKVGEAVKKGGKAFVRYNPVTISARNGFLLALKLNIKKMGSKLKWGYATKEQAAAKNINADQWEKSKNALTKVEKLFADKLQGKRDKLKNAILKGKAGGLNGFDEEFDLSGLGVAPAAAALVAAVPVIASCLKIMVESGVMTQKEADDLQTEIDAKSAEGEALMADDPDFKDEATGDGSTDDSGSDDEEGGFVGFVKKNPLVVIGGAGLAVWGLSKLFSGKKKTAAKSLSGDKDATKKKKAAPKSKTKTRSRKAKINSIRLS